MLRISQRARRQSAGSPGVSAQAITKGRTSSVAVEPYAAHVARLQAIDPSGSYYTGQDYTASLSQAGRFVDAFGGALTYDSPNVLASPSRVVDAQSGMVYAWADGADDTALGSVSETVPVYTAVWQAGATPFRNYGAIFDAADSSWGGILEAGTTHLRQNYSGTPSAVRRNGVAQSTFDLAPLTRWMVVTIYRTTGLPASVMQMGGFGFIQNPSYLLPMGLAALRKWSAAPTPAIVAATEAELASYYGPLIATNPA